MNGARTVRYLMVLFLFALTLIVTPTAQAAMPSGSAARRQRIAATTPANVTYHGGPVMTGTMNVYAIFWEPAGWVVDPNYNNLIMQYYNDVGTSSLYTIMNQYAQKGGGAPSSAVLADSWVDPDLYPGSGNPRPLPTDEQILQEIQTAMQARGWVAGPSNYFAVYTAEGIVDTADNKECAHHSADRTNTIIFGYIPYPDPVTGCLVPNSPNNCQVCDSAISTTAHEQFEAATDPLNPPSPEGWFYQTDTDGEIADLCTDIWYSADRYGTLLYDNGKANQLWNGHFYLIQEMWDNSTNSGKGSCSQGSQIAAYPIPTSYSVPEGITAGPDGNLWFTEYSANQIGRITPGGAITEYPIPTGNSLPEGITAGPDGNLWFTEAGANQIGKITPRGAITEYLIPTSSSAPVGITAGPDGNLWFTETAANQIGKITPGGAITEYPTNRYPVGVTADPDGNLWFTESLSYQIGKITPGGAITEYPTSGENEPNGITAGPDGNLWFTEISPNQLDFIGKITSNGAVTEYPLPTSLSYPVGITAGPDGNLWFTESQANQIGRITPGGAITEYPIPTATNSYPFGITAGSDGNLWFTEANVSQIGRITPGGSLAKFHSIRPTLHKPHK